MQLTWTRMRKEMNNIMLKFYVGQFSTQFRRKVMMVTKSGPLLHQRNLNFSSHVKLEDQSKVSSHSLSTTIPFHILADCQSPVNLRNFLQLHLLDLSDMQSNVIRESNGLLLVHDSPNNIRLSADDPATLIHTSFAKVYTMPIEGSPKTWCCVTQEAVPVSFYFDKQRSAYRILSYDKDKLVINSTISPSMNFIKPSSSFGLWRDTKLNIVYGLGFASKAGTDLTEEWFGKVVKEATSLNMSLPPPPHVTYAEPIAEWNKSHSELQMGESESINFKNNNNSPPPPDLISEELEIKELRSIRRTSIQHLEPQMKIIGMQVELNEVQNKFANVDRKEKLEQEIKEQLEIEKCRVEAAENQFLEEKQRAEGLEDEVKQLKSVIQEIKESNKQLELENKEIQKRLQQYVANANDTRENVNNFETACNEISENVKTLLKIQGNLKQNINSVRF